MFSFIKVYQSIVRKRTNIFFYLFFLELLISFPTSATEEGMVLYTPMEFKQVLESRIECPFPHKIAISSNVDIVQAGPFANLDEKTSVLHDKELGEIDELHVKGDLNLLGRITKYPKRIFVSGSLVINRHDESILTEEHSSLLENVSIDAGLNFFITGNNLLKLPHSVRARSINIKKCSKLSSLPEGMNGISINVSECHQLVNLPKQIHAYLVVIEDCDGLRELPLNCPFSNDFLNHGSIELAFKRCHNLQQQIPDNWSGIPFQSLMVTFDVSDKDRCDLWLQHKRRCKLNGSCDCEVPVIGGGLSQSN